MNFLGVDIGTSGCKAVVFDDDGRQVASAQREYSLHLTEDGGAELDSTVVMDHCLAVIAETARQAGRGTVKAIGIASQGEAFTPVDRHGQPLGPAMVSSDVRAAAQAQRWSQEFGADRLYQITGHTAHPLFTLFKLLWLRENRPAVWQGAAKFLCFEDLLQARLGLEPAMGWPLAGRTMLFDVRRHEWSGEILDRIGLSPDRLARPLASGTIAGTVTVDLGLAKDAVVVAGGHDQPCGALGAGATEPGTAMYATGTVECITPTFAQPVFTPTLQRNNLCTYDHAAPGMYTSVAYSLTGGNILKWYRDQFAPGQDYAEILKTAAPEPTKLLVLPYWTPSGTPYFDLHTPGGLLAPSSEPASAEGYTETSHYAAKSYAGPYGIPLRILLAKNIDNLMMAGVTDVLNRLFSTDAAPLRLARDAGLGLVNRIPPLKKILMRHAMGTVGELPRLMR